MNNVFALNKQLEGIGEVCLSEVCGNYMLLNERTPGLVADMAIAHIEHHRDNPKRFTDYEDTVYDMLDAYPGKLRKFFEAYTNAHAHEYAWANV